jgi:vacuolar protein sorting-associated protein 35
MDPGTKAQLYIELLNKYIFYYEKGHSGITEEILQELIKRIKEELPGLEAGSDESEQVTKHFDNTIAHIKVRQESGEEPSFKNVL